MSKEPKGLAAFVNKAQPTDTPTPSKATANRKRGEGETVALTVRVSRADWARLHHLAVAEGVSLQALALSGLSAVFAKHGLPPLAS